MQKKAILEDIFLYVGHKVRVCLSGDVTIEDELKNYDDEGIILSKHERKIIFSDIEDLVYVGRITAYDVKNEYGMIDNVYHFFKPNFMYLEEKDYKVFCHLQIKDIGTQNNDSRREALEIIAVDVEIYPIKKSLLDADFLQNKECFYFFKDGTGKVGTPIREDDKYKFICHNGQTCEIKPEDVLDIHKMPEKNDYVKIHTQKETIIGLVAMTGFVSCILLTDKNIKTEILYEDIKGIQYFGEIKISWDRNWADVKSVSKLYGNEETYDISVECDESELQNGTIVSFSIAVDDKKQPREFEATSLVVCAQPKEEETIETLVPVVVRRYEKKESEEGFWVIRQEDYDNNHVSKKSEFFVNANTQNIQSKKLKIKDYSYKDYQAQVDIYTTRDGKQRGVFCKKTQINNDKALNKKNFGHAIKYDFKNHMGYIYPDGTKIQSNGIRFFPDRGIKGWNSERFENKLSMLPKNNVGPGLPTYKGVYFIFSQNEKGYVNEISFIEVEEKSKEKTGGTEKNEVVEFNKFRDAMQMLYGEEEFDEYTIENYKFGLLITYGTKEYVLLQKKYEEGSKTKYPLVYIKRDSLISKEKIDTDYTVYVVAYLKDDENGDSQYAKEDAFGYVVAKYSVINKKRVNKITALELEEKRLLITKKTEAIDKKEINGFKKVMKPYEDEITFEAPALLTKETVLVQEGEEYLQKEGGDLTSSKDVYRFGVLTEIDPEEKYGYINHRLCFQVDKILQEKTFNNFVSNMSRPLLVCFKCDEHNRLTEVQFPSTEMMKCLKYYSGFVKKSYIPSVDIIKEKQVEVNIQFTNKQSNNGVYYFSGVGDSYVHKLADKKSEQSETVSELVSKPVWVKCVSGCEQKKNSKQSPCYVVQLVCKNEELTVEMDAQQSFFARRDSAIAYPLRGKKEVLDEYNGLRKNFVIKPDEETGELYAEIGGDITSKSILDMNPYKMAASGAALKVNTADDVREVFYKRDEEDEIWKYFTEGERNGSTIILYGQKRCGKTSLYGQVNYRLSKNNTLDMKPYIVPFNHMRDMNSNKLYRSILKAIIKDNELADVRKVIPMEVQNELKSFKKTDDSLRIIRKYIQKLGEIPAEVQAAITALDKKDAVYEWIEIIRAVIKEMKKNNRLLLVVMDEFTDFCADILEKHKGNWHEEEKIKDDLNFIKELEEAGALMIIIGHENMINFFERLGLVNSMIAKSNIIHLSVLNKESADNLICEPIKAKLGDIHYEAEAIQYMHTLTGRNPYVLMNLCSKMFDYLANHYEDYVIKRKRIMLKDVECVVTQWLLELKHDKVFFDMILKEAGDNWFFENNPVYEALFVGTQKSLAQVYLECVVSVMQDSEEEICDYNILHNALEQHIMQLLSQNDKLFDLDAMKKSHYIQEMIKLMERKLEERGVITILDNEINIVMKLYVKYLKEELCKGETNVGD